MLQSKRRRASAGVEMQGLAPGQKQAVAFKAQALVTVKCFIVNIANKLNYLSSSLNMHRSDDTTMSLRQAPHCFPAGGKELHRGRYKALHKLWQ